MLIVFFMYCHLIICIEVLIEWWEFLADIVEWQLRRKNLFHNCLHTCIMFDLNVIGTVSYKTKRIFIGRWCKQTNNLLKNKQNVTLTSPAKNNIKELQTSDPRISLN